MEVETDRGLVRRKYRYSEFYSLYNALKAKGIPGFPTKFPPKRLFHSAKTLEKRRLGFQRFMAQLLSIPDILNHEELRTFLGLRMVDPDNASSSLLPLDDGDGMGALRSKRFVSNTAKFRPRKPKSDGSPDSETQAPGPVLAPTPEAAPEQEAGRERGWSALEESLGEIEEHVAKVEAKRASMAPAPPPTSARASRIVSAAFISDLNAQLDEANGCASASASASASGASSSAVGGGGDESNNLILGVDRSVFADLLDDDEDDDEFFDMTEPTFDINSDDESSICGLDTSWSGIGPGLVNSPSIEVIEFLGSSEEDSEGEGDDSEEDELARSKAYEVFLHEVPLPSESDKKGVLDLVRAFAEFAQWPNINHAVAEEYAKLPSEARMLKGLQRILESNSRSLPEGMEPQLVLFLEDVAFRTEKDVDAWKATQEGMVTLPGSRPRRASSIYRSSVVSSLQRYARAFESASRALKVQVGAQSLPSIRDLLRVLVDAINGAASCLDEMDDDRLPSASDIKGPTASLLVAARPIFDTQSGWTLFADAQASLSDSMASLSSRLDELFPSMAPPPLSSASSSSSAAASAATSSSGSSLAAAPSPDGSRLIDPSRITRVRLLSSTQKAKRRDSLRTA